MNVLITGHRGYIGCHAVEVFQRAGHSVTGVDIGYFDDCSFGQRTHADIEITADVADLSVEQLHGHDAVIHLAAISNDPMGALDEQLTIRTNFDASMHLAELAVAAKVPRFLFSSSCAVYGDSQGQAADEDFMTSPQTAYARSKVAAEQALLDMDADGFAVTILRNATAYGYSPALRTDLVFNDFVARLVTDNKVHLLSDGSACRPLVHCRDIARAFLAVACADVADMSGTVLNVGDAAQNLKIIELARLVCASQDGAVLSFEDGVGHDQRDYLVGFSRLSQKLPNYQTNYSLITETEYLLNKCLERPNFGNEQAVGRYSRLQQLKNELSL
ncbi:MAG: SDR family oxidoreductase [Planctomycetes bacterium]|nr:SDR family oxidoreductase [Planctomycetota bacterium]